jgi:hypothetical protein
MVGNKLSPALRARGVFVRCCTGVVQGKAWRTVRGCHGTLRATGVSKVLQGKGWCMLQRQRRYRACIVELPAVLLFNYTAGCLFICVPNAGSTRRPSSSWTRWTP